MEIEIKKLEPQNVEDFADLINVFAIVFEVSDLAMPNSQYLSSLLNKPDFFVIIAKCDGKVIGGLTVYVLHKYYSSKPIAYIYDVGIVSHYQRKGIGKKLIAYLIHYCKENGFEEAYVEAEANDTQAVNFYRTTPVNSELRAVHFNYALA